MQDMNINIINGLLILLDAAILCYFSLVIGFKRIIKSLSLLSELRANGKGGKNAISLRKRFIEYNLISFASFVIPTSVPIVWIYYFPFTTLLPMFATWTLVAVLINSLLKPKAIHFVILIVVMLIAVYFYIPLATI